MSGLILSIFKGLVPIISAYAGMTDELIDMLDLEQLDGLVIQAFGTGNVPKETAQKLENLLQKGIPVALVSRCFNGIAEPVYAYKGGGSVAKSGVLFVKELNAQKARLKLLIALNAGLKGQALKTIWKANPLLWNTKSGNLTIS